MRQFDIEKVEKEKPVPSKKPKKETSLLPYLLGFLLGLLLVFGTLQLQDKKETIEAPVKETKTQEEVKQEKQQVAASKKEEPSVLEPKEEEPTPPPLDKSKIAIQVLNGNGIRGDAYKTKLVLEKDGWKVKSYGNASSFKYQSTLVYYKEGQEEAGKEVEGTLKNNGRETNLKKSDYLKKYDVLVIVGKK